MNDKQKIRMVDIVMFFDKPSEIDVDDQWWKYLRDKPFSLGEGLWIKSMDKKTSQLILKACQPAGFNYTNESEVNDLYCFGLDAGALEETKWDNDGKLQRAITLSRLIHPTTIGFTYCARIVYKGGGVSKIIPHLEVNNGMKGSITHKLRNFLSLEDIEKLKTLIKNDQINPFKESLNASLYHFEKAYLHQNMNTRTLFFSVALESICHAHGGQKFNSRLMDLAKRVGVMIADQKEAEKIYQLRANIPFLKPAFELSEIILKRYEKMEQLVQKIFIKAINESQFAKHITDIYNLRM